MRLATSSSVRGLLTLTVLSIVQTGCDPRADALALFANKGLNLLSPARDYIQPGGMVFLPRGGTPEYDDPADGIVGEDGTLTDFRADILQEALTKTSKFSAALSLAKTILPMSLGADAATDRDVKLGEIQTTGVRLKTDAIDSLIKMPNTSKAAQQALGQHMRVFVVQEVLKATSLDLTASTGGSFAVHYNDGKAVVDCKKVTPAESKNSPNSSSDSSTKDSTTKQGSSLDQPAGSGSQKGGKTASTASKDTAKKKFNTKSAEFIDHHAGQHFQSDGWAGFLRRWGLHAENENQGTHPICRPPR